MSNSSQSRGPRKASELAQGYSPVFRLIEILSILTFGILTLMIIARAAHFARPSPWIITSAFLLGWIGADFVSGLVHWAGDTWGTIEWPFLGKTIIRPFREHHVDALAMTRHDFVESVGSHCLVSLWVMIIAVLIPLPEENHGLQLFIVVWMGSLTFMTLLTAMTHKWAHMSKVNGLIRFCQQTGLMLSPRHHAVHHTPPFDQYYCITTGWLNPLLTRIRFFRHAETFITWLTGAIPRQDDLGLPVESASAPAESTSEHSA